MFFKSSNKAQNISDFTLAALSVMSMLRDQSCFCTAFSDEKMMSYGCVHLLLAFLLLLSGCYVTRR
jgi:hypothetical protein